MSSYPRARITPARSRTPGPIPGHPGANPGHPGVAPESPGLAPDTRGYPQESGATPGVSGATPAPNPPCDNAESRWQGQVVSP